MEKPPLAHPFPVILPSDLHSDTDNDGFDEIITANPEFS